MINIDYEKLTTNMIIDILRFNNKLPNGVIPTNDNFLLAIIMTEMEELGSTDIEFDSENVLKVLTDLNITEQLLDLIEIKIKAKTVEELYKMEIANIKYRIKNRFTI